MKSKNSENFKRQVSRSLHHCSKPKNKWILWMILENFKMWNQIIVEGCHVSSQIVMILSSHFMLGRDKGLPLDTWNQSGLQDNVLGNQLKTFDSPRNHPQRIQSDDVQRTREAVSRKTRYYSHKWRRTKSKHNSNADIATRPLTLNSTIRVGLTQNYMVGQQR